METVFKPILVNVVTAGILFVTALIFKPQLYDLLTPPGIPQYPLVCYAEPRPGEVLTARRVEFFVINLKGERLDRADLQGILKNFGPEDRLLTPDIRLTMGDLERGQIASAITNTPFNDRKGEIETQISPNGRSVDLHINWIEEWAIMRVDLHFTGMRNLVTDIHRMAKNMVPFEYRHLQHGCFEG